MYFTTSTVPSIENDQSKQKGHLGFFFVAVAYTKLMLVFFFHDQIAQRKYFEYEELDPLTDVFGVLQGDCLRAFMTDANKRFDANFREEGFGRLWWESS